MTCFELNDANSNLARHLHVLATARLSDGFTCVLISLWPFGSFTSTCPASPVGDTYQPMVAEASLNPPPIPSKQLVGHGELQSLDLNNRMTVLWNSDWLAKTVGKTPAGVIFLCTTG